MYRSSFSTLLKLMSGLVLVLATACGGADDGGQVAIADQPEAAQPTTAASEPTPSEAQDVEPSDHEGLGDGGDDDEHEGLGGGEDDHEHEGLGGGEDDHEHEVPGDGEDDHDDGGSGSEQGDEGVAADVLAAAEAMVEAYNAGDWDAFTAVLGTTEPTWETGIGVASTDHIRADFDWSQALNQIMTLDGCVEDFGFLTCNVIIEDDVHRAVVDFGIEPSRCRMVFEVEDGPILSPVRYDLTTCFAGYDQAFHVFGGWYEETYPDEETIQGFHYRAWNQFGEGAPERAAAVLAEWVATFPEDG